MELVAYLSFERFDDELETGRLHGFYALLDHVVAVLILDALENALLQFSYDPLLLVQGDALQGFLDHSAAVHLEREWLDVGTKLKGRTTQRSRTCSCCALIPAR